MAPPIFAAAYEPRIKLFRASYGSVSLLMIPGASSSGIKLNDKADMLGQILFYDDPAALQEMVEKRPMLKDLFPQCERLLVLTQRVVGPLVVTC